MYKKFCLIISLFAAGNLHPVIVGIGVLKDKKSDHKVAVLYDFHDIGLNQTARQQQLDLTKLICALGQLKNESSFFIEYPYLTTNFKRINDFSTIHMPIRHALENEMKSGSIQYKSFDKRPEIYFWVREIMLNFYQLKEALKHGQVMPKEYDAASIESYLQALQADEKEAQKLLETLPATAQKLVAEKMKLYPQAQEFIKDQTTHAKLTVKDHILRLFERIGSFPYFREKLCSVLIPAQELNVDVSLLHAVLNDKKPLSIVHAGSYHAQLLEKALLDTEFEDALPGQDLKNGLNAEDLSNLKIPSKNLDSILRPLSQFLGLCDACGKETATRCGVCKSTYFCDKKCQKDVWKVHKHLCKKPVEKSAGEEKVAAAQAASQSEERS